MKKYLLFCSVIVLLSGACSVDATQTSTDSPLTETEVPTSTSTVTSSPPNTPIIVTPTFTSIPSIPSSTPTFDVSSIRIATPAIAAICPSVNPIKNPSFDFLNLFPGMDWENRAHAEENILNFLNSYGADPLIEYLRYNYGTEGKSFLYKDLTNDSIPELAIRLTGFFIFGCNKGKYEKLLELPPDGQLMPPRILLSKDNNRNGLLELTLLIGIWSQGGHAYQVYEWDGMHFRNLLVSDYSDYPDAGEIWVEATGKIFYQDIDHDLLNELILDSGIPIWSIYHDGLPWRNKRTIYEWNGQNYIPSKFEFASPEFRFQAIQDGDLAFSQEEFDKALSLYQDAIFSDKLKNYSPEIRKNLQDNWMSQVGEVRPTPTPYPSDPNEYPRLAAYAYYRIMLIHLARGYKSDAMTIFNTLQQKFQEDDSGYLYAEMATAFMLKYQSTHEMASACDSAIQFAEEHPEILVPLGSDYHGRQSQVYKPEVICPFR